MEIIIVKKTNNNYFKNKSFIGLVGEATDLKSLVNETETLKVNINKKVKAVIGKNTDFIKPLGLDNNILSLRMTELSGTDFKLIALISAILQKPEIIILNNFENGLSDRTINLVIRFLKTINATFNIKFVVISRNVKFLNKIVKDIIVMKNKIIKYQGEILSAIQQKLLKSPEIIQFIELANRKEKRVDYTLDEKELLKDIYRSVT